MLSQYHEFLNKPYIKMVKARQIDNPPDNLVRNTLTFVDQVRKDKQLLADCKADDQDKESTSLIPKYREFFERMMSFKVEKAIYHLEASRVVLKYMDAIGMLSKDPMQMRVTAA